MSIRVALANGQQFDMGDVDPQVYLDRWLVPKMPNLSGGTFSTSTRVNANGDTEDVFTFVAVAATKG